MANSDPTLLQQTNDDRVSDRLLAALAKKEGTSPLEFDRPLNDVVDLDALDSLFQKSGREGTVEFSYIGYRVAIDENGEIEISGDHDHVYRTEE